VRIVRSGVWLYDDLVDRPVDIVSLAFDYWYELARADGQLEHGEQPTPMGPDGCLYYVRFRAAGSTATPTTVDSIGFSRLVDAAEAANLKAPSPIRWET
jgi:hypothetical protein